MIAINEMNTKTEKKLVKSIKIETKQNLSPEFDHTKEKQCEKKRLKYEK